MSWQQKTVYALLAVMAFPFFFLGLAINCVVAGIYHGWDFGKTFGPGKQL